MTCSQQERKSNLLFNVAVGMGVPFRFILLVVASPFWIFVLFVFAVVSPHKELPALLADVNDAWYWLWHGKKKL